MRLLENFIGAIKKRQAEIALSLTAGNAVNYESYQRLVGQHAGLEEASDLLNNLLKEENEREL